MPRFGPRPLSRHPEVAHAALSRARRIRFIGARAAGGRPRRCPTAVAQTVTVDKETVASTVSDQLAKQVGVALIR
jgi:hypothetical protein